MTGIRLTLALCAALLPAALPSLAWAGNVAHCEALILKTVEDESAAGKAQIASYRPATEFLSSLYDDEDGHLEDIDGFPIRAIMCRRNDVIPSEADYPILATGMPLALSQDFDSQDTDSLTIYWKDGVIDYVYKGHPLSDEAQTILDTRLADFTARGLDKTPDEAAPDADEESESAEEKSENPEDKTEHKVENEK